MAITNTLQNLSSESAESVDIKPFSRSGWVEMTGVIPPNGATSFTQSKIAGDDELYPLIKQVTMRPTKVFHPDHPQRRYDGFRRSVAVYSTVKREDSVTGLIEYDPFGVDIAILSKGPVILDTTDALDFVLSVAAELYDSVTTGDVDTAAFAKLALGATNF